MDEQRELEQAAERYRQEGYTVEVRPSGASLPGFLDSFKPDLIARKNGEQVVVQVRPRAELGADRAVGLLAEAVNAQPGWRFDLVVPAHGLEANGLGTEQTEALLGIARRLLDWAPAEAAP